MREMGMNQPVVGSNGFNSPQFIKIAGDAANGVIVGTPWFPNKEDQKVKDFRKAYVAKYGKNLTNSLLKHMMQYISMRQLCKKSRVHNRSRKIPGSIEKYC